MSSGIANAANPTANPVNVERIGSGSDGSAEGAAEAFTEFLEDEADGASERRRPNPKAQRREAPRQTDGAEGDEGQPPKRQPKRERQEAPDDDDGDNDDPLHDPILDAKPGAKRKGGDDEGDDADEDEGDDEGEGDENDEGDEDEDDDDPEHEVTVRGVPTKVKQSELIQGYLREADYRQKTTALSQDRQVVEQAYGVATQRVETLDAVIQTYQDLINAVMPSQQEWEALKAKDPNAYITAQEQWGGFLEKMETAKAHREQLAGTKSQEEVRQSNEYMRAENQKLLKLLPQLQEPKIAKAFANTIFGYGKKMGYSDEEMKAGLINHRDVMTAYYAGKYLELQESRQANRQQAKKGAPRQSEGNSQVRPPQTRQGRKASNNRQEQRRADRQAQRSGSVQDAAHSFAAMFRD